MSRAGCSCGHNCSALSRRWVQQAGKQALGAQAISKTAAERNGTHPIKELRGVKSVRVKALLQQHHWHTRLATRLSKLEQPAPKLIVACRGEAKHQVTVETEASRTATMGQ